MAVKAFVLIETRVGKSSEVTASLQKMEFVKTAVPVTGPWDIIVVAEGEMLSDIANLIMGKMKQVNGITRTMTCLTTGSIISRINTPVSGCQGL
ncbi:MAG: Lrp/AsnC family transcriptional regulator [Chloroflexi bacterium]|nr:Lrp/AsnC family transcriptional regulator [Chloroflexota bacterium]